MIMVFSDRVREICNDYNATLNAVNVARRDAEKIALLSRIEALDYCLATLGIPLIRCEGHISAFEIMGHEMEIAS